MDVYVLEVLLLAAPAPTTPVVEKLIAPRRSAGIQIQWTREREGEKDLQPDANINVW